MFFWFQGGDLKSLFLSFAGYGTRQVMICSDCARDPFNGPKTIQLPLRLQDQQELEGSKFKKLCSDCGIVDKKFTVTDVDLTFAKVNSPSQVVSCQI